LDETNHVGPLIDTDAVNMYQEAIKNVKKKAENSSLKVKF
jgi:aldehyde dehydrogenase (NAD+)